MPANMERRSTGEVHDWRYGCWVALGRRCKEAPLGGAVGRASGTVGLPKAPKSSRAQPSKRR